MGAQLDSGSVKTPKFILRFVEVRHGQRLQCTPQRLSITSTTAGSGRDLGDTLGWAAVLTTAAPRMLLYCSLIFSIITFALVADYNGNSEINFVLFTGITAMLFTLTFIVFYLLGAGDNVVVNATLALVELIVNVVWWILWLAAAACLAHLINGSFIDYVEGDKVKAACAFAWLTWALWSVSTFFSVKEIMGRNSAQPSSTGVGGYSLLPMGMLFPMGTQPAVAMV